MMSEKDLNEILKNLKNLKNKINQTKIQKMMTKNYQRKNQMMVIQEK